MIGACTATSKPSSGDNPDGMEASVSERASLVGEQIRTAFEGTGASIGPLRTLCEQHPKAALLPILLGLELDEEEDLHSANRGGDEDERLSVEEGGHQVYCAARLAAANLCRRSGDVDKELVILRHLASFCGGRSSGIFARQATTPGGREVVIPLTAAGWWWLGRYVEVLLRIGDAWSRRGQPSK